MISLNWCAKQSRGFQVIEPNSNLAKDYSIKAETALESIKTETAKEWKIVKAYYAMYFSLYAIMLKLGIKCENHTCTILFMKELLSEFFSPEECKLLKESMKARVDSQYYTNREVADDFYQSILKQAPIFLMKCKSIGLNLNERRIQEIRRNFQLKITYK